jgi:hypothetical protein
MSESPPVLIVDDGELGEVRRALAALEVEFASARGASDARIPLPRRLLITTPRHAHRWNGELGDGGAPVRLVVADEDSPALRRSLRRAGFDFLVRRPVSEPLIRLMVLRSLYVGPERRANGRVPAGRPVSYRVGSRWCDGRLIDVSDGGCRLVASEALQADTRIHLRVPAGRPTGAPLFLHGTVVRCADASEAGGSADERCLGLAFGGVEQELLRDLRALVAEGGSLQPTPADLGAERRLYRRGAYDTAVRSHGDEAERVLLGRDLSKGGMRVEPHPSLRVGERLKLGIHTGERAEPCVVEAVVVRDDGPEGLALRFESVGEESADRLEALVAGLPPIESLRHGEPDALGAVVSQILREA